MDDVDLGRFLDAREGPMDDHDKPTIEMLAFRVGMTEKALSEIRDAMRAIESSLRTLTQLEQHHAATREKLMELASSQSTLEARLRSLEQEMPGLKMIKGWVVMGTLGIVSLVGVAAFKIIMGG